MFVFTFSTVRNQRPPGKGLVLFIGAAVLFLPLFVFLPKLIQRGLDADVDAAIEAFGKNEQVKRVFWTLFAAMSGVVLVQVVYPVTAREVVGMITGMGV